VKQNLLLYGFTWIPNIWKSETYMKSRLKTHVEPHNNGLHFELKVGGSHFMWKVGNVIIGFVSIKMLFRDSLGKNLNL